MPDVVHERLKAVEATVRAFLEGEPLAREIALLTLDGVSYEDALTQARAAAEAEAEMMIVAIAEAEPAAPRRARRAPASALEAEPAD